MIRHPDNAGPGRDLTEQQLRRLFVRWQEDRDQEAREVLVTRFMPLARKLAKRYLSANEPFDDLLQVANLGLLRAIDRFDPHRNIRFSSFAVPTILGELRRYFRDRGWSVHVPRGAQERALTVRRAVQDWTQEHGRPPTVDSLAQLLEWPVEDVLDALEAANGHHSVSLESPVEGSDQETLTLADSLGTEDARFDFVIDWLSAVSAVQQLEPGQRQLLQLRFIEGLTQAEIGTRIGVSQMQVSRLLRETLDSLAALAEPTEITTRVGADPHPRWRAPEPLSR